MSATHILRTEDGYTFYVLANGRVVDNLDPDMVDMSWPSMATFALEADVDYVVEGAP